MKEVILIPSYEPDNRLVDLVKKIDKERFDIIVVNDGSDDSYNKIFDKIINDAHVISYDKNQGKGYALKTGIKYIKEKYHDNFLIVTMDSDGQHTISDAIKLCDYTKNHLKTYVLGMRKRSEKTPLKSRLGNGITKFVYNLITGINVYDTQTGLRCFSSNLTDFMLNVPGNRFEYEMNALLLSSKSGIEIHEIEIETIYLDNNKGTHFKALRDSFLIYKEIIKFSFASIISFLIDYSLFTIFSFFLNSLMLSNIFARIISASCNYLLNRKYVFESKNNLLKSILSYSLLSISILILNTILLHIFVNIFLINRFISKLIVEIILFIVNYFVQKKIIFKRR